ncbi:MAG TPA: FtsX-like permease family protein [Terriglobia bacterium]
MRMALGASRRNIFTLVLGQSLRLVLAGLAAGIMAALALTRTLAAFLYGINSTDPLTFLAVAALLLAIALVAGYLPARRAAGVNPLTALRCE